MGTTDLQCISAPPNSSAVTISPAVIITQHIHYIREYGHKTYTHTHKDIINTVYLKQIGC